MRSCLLFLLFCLMPEQVLAGSALRDDEVEGQYEIVQERAFPLRHELSLAAGLLPLDAFYKGVTATLSYAHHFSNHFAWQVGRATYSGNVPTGLKRQLEREFGVLPTAFREVQWMLGSDVMWSPLYGKVALLNRTLIHLQIYVLAGATLLKTQDAFAPALNLGLGSRWYISQQLSLRVEVNNHLAPGKATLMVPMFQVGLSFNLGRS